MLVAYSWLMPSPSKSVAFNAGEGEGEGVGSGVDVGVGVSSRISEAAVTTKASEKTMARIVGESR